MAIAASRTSQAPMWDQLRKAKKKNPMKGKYKKSKRTNQTYTMREKSNQGTRIKML